VDQALLMIAAVFVLAGFVKGMLGLGMPTVAIGLLALSMPPARAIAITIVPALITNIWQAFAGPYLRTLLLRLWPLFAATVLGVLLGRGLMIGPYARYGTVLLGLLLAIYATIGLAKVRFEVTPKHETWIGALAGLASGVVSAATGIQVIPSMPFLSAIGLGRDELVQALGLFFMTATTALIFNLNGAGLLTSAIIAPALVALVCAFIGMFVGQALRERMHPDTFRRWFLIALLVFGLYLAGNATLALRADA
jgi:uncharacterized membrane protein YfcA